MLNKGTVNLFSRQTRATILNTEVAFQRCSKEKVFLKICSKLTGEHSCRSAILLKLPCTFIKIAIRHGCSSVNLLPIFRIPFPDNTSEGLPL